MSSTGSAYYEAKKIRPSRHEEIADVGAHLAQTRRKNDNLVDLAHLLQEVVDTGALDHVHIMPIILDLDWDHVVGLLY